jgi:mRNA interferase MazF
MALVTPRRFEVWLVSLDPAVGSEIRKTRPCAVISPDEMNGAIRTVIVAPMTSATRPWPSPMAVTFARTAGQVVLDQIRTVDRARLVKRLGTLGEAEARAVCDLLARLFAW